MPRASRPSRGALPEGAAARFTPESVGTAVRRALVTAPGWRDFDWEIVHEKAVSPRMNLALDEVLDARRRGATQADPADLGVERVGRRDRLVPVVPQRGRPRGAGGTASTSSAHLRRRRDDDGRRSIVTYSLYVPASLVAA
jgi:lipoate-protein ligase A